MDPAVSLLGELPIENVYHVSFLVEDIDEGMARYGAAFGCGWAEPGQATYPGTGDAEWPITFVYSTSGPPFIELLTGVDDPGCAMGFSHTGGRPGFHHLGVYAERWRDEVARLEAAGMTTIFTGQGMAFLMSPMGFGIEVVSWKGRTWLHQYMARNGVDIAARGAAAGAPA
jgi:hypothetical protein